MPLLVERKLFKIGEGGFAVTLPKAWINYHRLKPGDTVEVVVDESRLRPVKSEVQRLLADNRQALQRLGWSPKVGLSEGLKLTIDWISSHLDLYRPGQYQV